MKKIITIFVLITMMLFSKSINEQIKTLKNLSPAKRILMMNRIKKQLISMNKQERIKTINLLKRKMLPNNKKLPHLKKVVLKANLPQRGIARPNILQIYGHPNLQKDKIKRFIKNRRIRK